MIQRQALDAYLHHQLRVGDFKDYGPNGIQVEGKPEISHIVSGVTASQDLIDAAIDARADALLVHHGLFWRGYEGRLTGWLKKRVQALMAHDITLLAYHLPLDAHPDWGNNAMWGEKLGLSAQARFGEQSLGFIGPAPEGLSLQSLAVRVRLDSGRDPLVFAGDGRALKTVAWCSGGAQGYFEAAMAAGADVFLTGEVSEPQMHLAKETGVAFMACGHHASERHGVQALGQHLASEFGVAHHFIDIDNPV